MRARVQLIVCLVLAYTSCAVLGSSSRAHRLAQAAWQDQSMLEAMSGGPALFHDAANGESYLRAPYLPATVNGPMYQRKGPQSGVAKEWLEQGAQPPWSALPFGPRTPSAAYVLPWDHMREVQDEFSWNYDHKNPAAPPQFSFAAPIFLEESSDAETETETETETEAEADADADVDADADAETESKAKSSCPCDESFIEGASDSKDCGCDDAFVEAPKEVESKAKGSCPCDDSFLEGASDSDSKDCGCDDAFIQAPKALIEAKTKSSCPCDDESFLEGASDSDSKDCGCDDAFIQAIEVQGPLAAALDSETESGAAVDAVLLEGGPQLIPDDFWSQRTVGPGFNSYTNPYHDLTNPTTVGSGQDYRWYNRGAGVRGLQAYGQSGYFGLPRGGWRPHPSPYAYHQGKLPPFAHQIEPFKHMANLSPNVLNVGENEELQTFTSTNHPDAVSFIEAEQQDGCVNCVFIQVQQRAQASNCTA